MQARVVERLQISLNGATGTSRGPVKVEFAGLAKSTWNLKKNRSVASARPSMKLGAPAGGRSLLSKSDGSRLDTLEGCWKQTAVAGSPASIFARSYAHAIAPANFGAKMLKVA